MKKILSICFAAVLLFASAAPVMAASVEMGAVQDVAEMAADHQAQSIASYGDYLYVSARAGGVKIYHVTDTGVEEIAVTDNALKSQLPESPNSLRVYDGYLYMGVDQGNYLRKFSLNNPESPVLEATFSGVKPLDIWVGGGYVFATNASGRIMYYPNDTSGVTDPASGISGKNLFIGSPNSRLAVKDNILYTNFSQTNNDQVHNGLYAFDITETDKLSPQTTWENWTKEPQQYYVAHREVANSRINMLQIDGDYLYANDPENRAIYRIDISNPANLADETKWQTIQTEYQCNAILVQDGLLFLGQKGGGGSNKISVIDLSDPNFPILFETTAGNDNWCMLIHDGMLYTAARTKVLRLPITQYAIAADVPEGTVSALPLELGGAVSGSGEVTLEFKSEDMQKPSVVTPMVSDGAWNISIADIYDGIYQVTAKLTAEGQAKAETSFDLEVKTRDGEPITDKNTVQNDTDVEAVEMTASIAHETKTVTCMGKIPMRTRIGFKETEIALKAPDGQQVYQASQLSLGNFSFQFALPEPCVENQDYTLVFSCEGEPDVSRTFRYFGEGTVQTALAAVKAAETPEMLRAVLLNEEYAPVLLIDLSEESPFGKLKDQDAVLLALCGKDFNSTEELHTAFYQALAAQQNVEAAMERLRACDTLEGFQQQLAADSQSIGISLETEPYLDLTETIRERLYQELFDGREDLTPADLQTCFAEDSMLLRLMNQSGWSDLGSHYSKYSDKLGISSSVLRAYEDLSETERANVDKEVARGSESEYYEELHEVGESLSAAVSKYQGSGSGGTGGGGTGGSRPNSSGGSNMTITSPNVPPQSDEEPEQTAPETPFQDLADVDWAKENILSLYEKGIISGKGNGLFAPQDAVSREEFLKMLIGALGITAEKAALPFEDVVPGAWYEEPIATAVGAGIINGVSENRFGVGEPITREQMAVMIDRAVLYLGAELDMVSEAQYTDAISEYAQEAVKRVSGAGIMNGVGEGKFDALSSATRAQAAKVIDETMKKVK